MKPILAAHCVKCHGAEKQRGGLRLDDRKAALDGGYDVVATGHNLDDEAAVLFGGAYGDDPDDLPDVDADPDQERR